MTKNWAKETWEAHSGEDYTVVMREGECTENASIHIFGEDANKISLFIAIAPRLYEELQALRSQVEEWRTSGKPNFSSILKLMDTSDDALRQARGEK